MRATEILKLGELTTGQLVGSEVDAADGTESEGGWEAAVQTLESSILDSRILLILCSLN